jgi:hypothetical protein
MCGNTPVPPRDTFFGLAESSEKIFSVDNFGSAEFGEKPTVIVPCAPARILIAGENVCDWGVPVPPVTVKLVASPPVIVAEEMFKSLVPVLLMTNGVEYNVPRTVFGIFNTSLEDKWGYTPKPLTPMASGEWFGSFVVKRIESVKGRFDGALNV